MSINTIRLIPNDVYWCGAQREVIQGGDLSARISLRDLEDQRALYAVGPQAGLVGELTVVDSRPYVAHVQSGRSAINENWAAGACFLVYASVPHWQPGDVQHEVANLLDLETVLADVARRAGIDPSKPFAFRVQGEVAALAYHILNRTDVLPHNEERHEAIKAHFLLKNVSIDGIGFYSESHTGIFIPKGKRIHVHFVSSSLAESGHVDAIQFARAPSLLLPRT